MGGFMRGSISQTKRAMREYARHHRPRKSEVERTFAKARECIREYERDQQSQQEAYELVMWIRDGGEI